MLGIVIISASVAFTAGLTDQASRAVEHALEVRDRIDAVHTDLVQAESAARGWVLSGKGDFVPVWESATSRLPLDLDRLQSITLDNPRLVEAMQILRQQAAGRLGLIQQLFALVPGSASRGAVRLVERGEDAMASIRQTLDVMDREENGLLAERRSAQHRARWLRLATIIAGIALGMAGGALAVVVFARGIGRRVRAIEHNARMLEAGRPLGPMPSGDDEVGQLGRSLERAAEIAAARERTIAERAAEVEDLYDHAPCGYHSLDANGLIVRINETELGWLGYTRDELVGRMRYPELLSSESAELFERQYPAFVERGVVSDIEFELVRKDGSRLPVSLSATAVLDAEGSFLRSRSTVFDISERRRHDEELRELATLDELTGLLNRRGFLSLTDQAVKLAGRTGLPLALLFCDLDDLKVVNDTHGHEEGSRLLAEAADVLRACTRESDIVGRVGGDEFAALLTVAEPDGVPGVMDRIRETIARRNAETPHVFRLSMSIGWAAFDPSRPVGIDELIREADLRMYEQKQARNVSTRG
jgi:diguanylate cyclase (GGDEF)-like protein/PAS domain S-box-containing protein